MTKKRNPNRIAEFRQRKQLNQSELAEKLGVHWVTVSKLERGVMKLTQEWMDRLSNVFGIEPAELISDSPLVRTVHVQGFITDVGQISSDDAELTPEDNAIAFDVEIGAREPERTAWFFVNTHVYQPFFQMGDIVRFTYPIILEPSRYLGRICLIDNAGPQNLRLVGLLQRGSGQGLYDLQMFGGATVRDIRIEDMAYLSMAVLEPKHIVDEDGVPLP